MSQEMELRRCHSMVNIGLVRKEGKSQISFQTQMSTESKGGHCNTNSGVPLLQNIDCETGDPMELEYADPTMILTKSRVTIGLLGAVILTVSTMMIFVILSVRIESRGDQPLPLYVISECDTIWNSITHFIFPTFYIPVPESATARVGSKFLAPATNTSSIFYDNVDNFHADVNGTWINKFARN